MLLEFPASIMEIVNERRSLYNLNHVGDITGILSMSPLWKQISPFMSGSLCWLQFSSLHHEISAHNVLILPS